MNNQSEVGYGPNYNPAWDNQTQVSDLDSYQNCQQYQNMKLTAGNYLLSFDHAARVGQSL